MRYRKIILAITMIAAALPARAGELDTLLDRLVEKNVLDPGEAQEIRIGTQEDVKKEISQQRHATLPMWLQTMKFRGDVRIRYQYNDNDNNTYTQHRLRYRLRFFVDAKVNDQVYTGFGFASGSNADPRSTNQTFADNFAKKSIYLDYIFAEYDPGEYLSVTAGRNRNPLWTTNDMLWDADINPEGLSARVTRPLDYNWQLFVNAGYFVLGEAAADPQDPGLFFAQPGFSWRDSDNVYDVKAGAAVYGFSHVKGRAAFGNRPSAAEYQQSNTLSGGKYKYGYNSVSPEFEANMNILDPVAVPLLGYFGYNVTYAGVYGNYIQNTERSRDNKGWIAGFRIGQRKVEDAGQWQFGWNLRQLQKDAWLDTYPDSDFYGGSTNVEGQKCQLSVGLLRDFAVNMAWFDARPVSNSARRREHLLQADVNLKF